MDEPSLFEPGDYLHLPSGSGFDPLFEDLRIVAIAHGAGCDNPDPVYSAALHGAMNTPQDLQLAGHCLGSESAIAKNTFTQARHLSILVQRNKLSFAKFGNAKTNGVGTDIDCGKDRHCL